MVSGGHVAIGGGLTPLLAQALQYFSSWPLAALDGNTSMAIAGLIVAGVGGGGLAWFGAEGREIRLMRGSAPLWSKANEEVAPVFPAAPLSAKMAAMAEPSDPVKAFMDKPAGS
jgi:hypothetical protein